MKEFTAFLGPQGLLAFAIIFLILGALAVTWLIMYQEADPDRTFRGAVARAFATAMFWGMAIFLFLVRSGYLA
ncbi:MAG: hypothetical protein FK734_07000 [Asgard group archaeon]|nr:hypothetical protein [Asgard group archaeon]